MVKLFGAIGGIFTIVAVISIALWAVKMPCLIQPNTLGQIRHLIAQVVIPWWLPAVKFLAD